MYNFNFEEGRKDNFNFYFGTTPKQFIIKDTATPGYVINSINVENLEGEDVLYVNTDGGVLRMFSSACSGIVGNWDTISSDYQSGVCGAEKLCVGSGTMLIEIDTLSGTVDSFELVGDVCEVLYYVW